MAAPRVRLEPLRVEHAEAMTAVLADPALYAFTGGGPPSADELRARYERWVAGSPDPAVRWRNWVVRLDTGELAGTVQATIAGEEAQVAWVVGRAWQGRGVGTAAARALVALLASQGVRTIVAHIRDGHRASEAVARAAGLTRTATVVDGEVRWERVTSVTP